MAKSKLKDKKLWLPDSCPKRRTDAVEQERKALEDFWAYANKHIEEFKPSTGNLLCGMKRN